MPGQKTGIVTITSKYLIYVVFLIPLLIIPFLNPGHFFMNVMILVFMYAVTASAWNILGGFIGQFSFGHAAFFGIGAYTTTIIFLNLWISPWYGMLMGATLSMAIGIIIGFLTFRLRGHYFALFTLAFAEIMRIIFLNWPAAGGAWGIKIPALSTTLADKIVNFQFYPAKEPYYYAFLGFLIIETLIIYKVKNSKWGYYFIAIREDEVVAECSGVNALKYKVIAFALSAFFTAIGGAMYTVYINFIDPEITLHIMISAQIMLGTVIGGMGTILGPILGTFFIMITAEYTRAMLGGLFRGVHLMIYGLILMIVAVFKPEGFMGIIESFLGRRKK
ncbi:MAG: branched-chain amino acid ABC transporter permease [Nitrososphaeria archaeon]|nr:branched-chain amino acid ABC transporter permease [Nitrososphaeria archaeon]NIQ33810.1 branched-chain amino acid ABC transporter permease [Nitrososphaeria archaeon]